MVHGHSVMSTCNPLKIRGKENRNINENGQDESYWDVENVPKLVYSDDFTTW